MRTSLVAEKGDRPKTVPAEPRPSTGAWRVTALAFVVAMVLGALLIAAFDDTVHGAVGYFFSAPGDTLGAAFDAVAAAYTALFQGAVFNVHNDGSAAGVFGPLMGTLFTATPLICAGLGISLAFRGGLFNIGGQGQVIAGAMASGYVAFACPLPAGVRLLAAVCAGVLAGAGWGFIAGFLKARTGANEVITTIMLNYIAIHLLHYLLGLDGVSAGPAAQGSRIIPTDARLPRLFGDQFPIDLGFPLALAAAGGLWWLLTRSVIGFRIRAVGANLAAARTAGMNVPRVTALTLTLSGALTGLAGVTLALGGATSYQVTPSIDSNVGFDAITVALLGRSGPGGTVCAGLLLGALRQGGATMQAQTSVPIDLVTVIQAFIIVFVAAPRLVRALFRLKAGRAVPQLIGATPGVESAVRSRVARHLVEGGAQVVMGVAAFVVLGLAARSSRPTVLRFSLPGAAVDLGSWSVTARPVVLAAAALVVVTGLARAGRRLPGKWSAAVSVFGLLTAFLFWAVAGTPSGLNVVTLLQGSLFPAAVPLILGGLAGVIGERAGIVNVALEGQLLLGAFLAALVASLTNSVWGGLAGGVVAGALLAAVLGVLAIRYLVDQVIVGVVLNIFALGLTSFLFIDFMTPYADRFNTPGHLPIWKIPVLGDIPIVGPVLFHGTILLYLTYGLVAAVHLGLFHTRWGLRLRSVGEHPRAADTVGVDVTRTRYGAVLLAGAIAGVAGAFLVLGTGAAGTFQLNMAAGKGFIALAAVIFGRWTPRGVVLAALLFGFADQLQSMLSQAGAPLDANLLLTLPYVATLVAVAGLIGRVRPPAAVGRPYAAAG